jgi:predicted lipoprotein with Yx(FWY)xxD motif
MMRARVGVLTAIAGMGLVGLTACGSDSTGSPVPRVPDRQQPQAVEARANLVAAEIGALGMGLTNEDGMTLYMFDKDSTSPPTSNCNDTCAKNWPPLLAQGKELTFVGVDEKLIGTVTRKDGAKQVTVNKWPVYLYAKDTAPGDANGQGMNGTWHVLGAEGKKIAGQAPAEQPRPQQAPAEQPPANSNTGGSSGSDSGYGY